MLPDWGRRLIDYMNDRTTVTVTNPDNPEGTWVGTVVGLYNEPVLILRLRNGKERALPQRFRVTPGEPGWNTADWPKNS